MINVSPQSKQYNLCMFALSKGSWFLRFYQLKPDIIKLNAKCSEPKNLGLETDLAWLTLNALPMEKSSAFFSVR